MKLSTTIRSWPSLAIGGFFGAVTAWTLLADVIAGAPLTPGHAMSAGAIIAAIASGHAAWPALRRGAVVPAALLCVLFAASTGYVVIASAARNAETGSAKAARIEATNAARQRELRQLAQAEAMHKSAVTRLDAECVRGKASKGTCDGIRATIAVYDAATRPTASAPRIRDTGPCAPLALQRLGTAPEKLRCLVGAVPNTSFDLDGHCPLPICPTVGLLNLGKG